MIPKVGFLPAVGRPFATIFMLASGHLPTAGSFGEAQGGSQTIGTTQPPKRGLILSGSFSEPGEANPK